MPEAEEKYYLQLTKDLINALEWALREGGWRLIQFADPDTIPNIIDASDMHNPRIVFPRLEEGDRGAN